MLTCGSGLSGIRTEGGSSTKGTNVVGFGGTSMTGGVVLTMVVLAKAGRNLSRTEGVVLAKAGG